MLTVRLLSTAVLLAGFAVPAVAQDFAPHRAVYSVVTLDKGKPGDGVPGTYAYELRLTCDGYVVNQRLRLEIPGARGMVVSEQQSQMTESRDGKKLHFEHRSTTDGRQTSLLKGDALLGDDGSRPGALHRPRGPDGGAAGRHAVSRGDCARDGAPGQGGRERLRCAVLLRREGEAAAVGQHGDRQGAQAARRGEDPRRRGATGRRPLADLLPGRLFRSPGQGTGAERRANPPSR